MKAMTIGGSNVNLPETPIKLKQKVPATNDKASYSPSTPSSPMMLQFKYKDYRSAIEAIQQLEIELNEFQQSSHELEKELEIELLDLELENEKLKQQNDEAHQDLKEAKYKLIEKETKYNESKSELLALIKTLQAELAEKKSRVVDIEIINDNFEQNERNYELKYNNLQEKYNQSLEKVILLETEISEISSKLLTEQLNHQNTQNELNEYKNKHENLFNNQSPFQLDKARSNSQTGRTFSLRNSPGTREPSGSIPTSRSLMALHSLMDQSQGLGSKLGSLKLSLTSSAAPKSKNVSKSSPTTKLSSEHVTISTSSAIHSTSPKKTLKPTTAAASAPISISLPKDLEQNSMNMASKSLSPTRRSIPSSPSSFQLSSIMQNKNLDNVKKLEAIEGSPNKELQKLTKTKDHRSKISNRFGNLVNPFKSKYK